MSKRNNGYSLQQLKRMANLDSVRGPTDAELRAIEAEEIDHASDYDLALVPLWRKDIVAIADMLSI